MRQAAERLMATRIPDAVARSKEEHGYTSTYGFTTNGVKLPIRVVVDRGTGEAHFEDN
jgi:hypothetical protein